MENTFNADSGCGDNRNTWCVYMHTNTINGKKYIGITSRRPNERWRNGKGYEPGQYFYNAIQKYGWESFKHEILFYGLSADEAKAKEIEMISKYHTTDELYGYNLTKGDEGALGRVVSEETRRKIGNANRGMKLSDDARAKISASLIGNQRAKGYKHTDEERRKISERSIGNQYAKGYKHTDETRQKISAGHIGIKFSDERRRKISEANKGRVLSEETKKKISDSKIGKTHKGCVMSDAAKKKMSDSKKELFEKEPWRRDEVAERNKIAVDMFSLDGEFIKTYESAKDASVECGIDNSSIGKVCKGKVKSAGGYLWRYHTN